MIDEWCWWLVVYGWRSMFDGRFFFGYKVDEVRLMRKVGGGG